MDEQRAMHSQQDDRLRAELENTFPASDALALTRRGQGDGAGLPLPNPRDAGHDRWPSLVVAGLAGMIIGLWLTR